MSLFFPLIEVKLKDLERDYSLVWSIITITEI
jgi:hypothetical protein